MEDKPSSSWDELIQQIGAAPPPDALERKRPAVTAKFDPPPVSAPPAEAKPSDWGALASKLGLEATEPPPQPRSAPREEEKPAAARDMEASFAGIEPLESDFEEVVEAEISEIDFIESDDSDLEGESADDDFDEFDPDSLSGEAARSAFEALFQAGSFSSLPTPRTPSREPDEARRRGSRPTPRREESREDDGSDDDVESTDEGGQSLEGETTSESSEEGRPRRRRRRGRGRGRGRDREDADRSAQAKDAAHADDADSDEGLADSLEDDAAEREPAVEGEESRDRPRRKRGRRRRRTGETREGAGESDRPAAANGRASARPAADDDDDDDDDDEPLLQADDGEEGDDDESGGSPRRASHKNIPTWSDAIGVMVETNLQSRKNSPQRPTGGRERSRGGRGRGRGRGGSRGKS
jgi:hypothetical protein